MVLVRQRSREGNGTEVLTHVPITTPLHAFPTLPHFPPPPHIGDIADRVSTTAAADTVDIVNIIHILDFVYFLVASMPYVDRLLLVFDGADVFGRTKYGSINEEGLRFAGPDVCGRIGN